MKVEQFLVDTRSDFQRRLDKLNRGGSGGSGGGEGGGDTAEAQANVDVGSAVDSSAHFGVQALQIVTAAAGGQAVLWPLVRRDGARLRHLRNASLGLPFVDFAAAAAELPMSGTAAASAPVHPAFEAVAAGLLQRYARYMRVGAGLPPAPRAPRAPALALISRSNRRRIVNGPV